MKTGNVILAAGVVLGVYYITQLGVATNTVSIIFEGVNIKTATEYEVIMRVQNVSNVSVSVNSMTGTLSLNSNPIADLSFFGGVTVPANGQVDIPVSVSISLFSLPATVKDLLNGGGSELNFNVTGNANVSGLVLPFDFDKTMSV